VATLPVGRIRFFSALFQVACFQFLPQYLTVLYQISGEDNAKMKEIISVPKLRHIFTHENVE
jgi:hypothetical protein